MKPTSELCHVQKRCFFFLVATVWFSSSSIISGDSVDDQTKPKHRSRLGPLEDENTTSVKADAFKQPDLE